MSIKLITAAFNIKLGNPLRKLILIKLADNANDNGWCWPSMKTIASQCDCSIDTVRRHVRAMADDEILEIHPVIDSATSVRVGTKYKILLDAMVVAESKDGGSREQGGVVAESNPNRHIEPSIEPSNTPLIYSPHSKKAKKEAPRQVLEHVLSPEDAAAVIEHRQRLRKPLTPRAAKILANAFSEIEPEKRSKAVDMMIVSGWTGFKAEWFNNRQQQNSCQPSRADMQPSELLAENVMRIPSQNIGRHTKEALMRWGMTKRGYVLSKDWKAVLVEIDTIVKALVKNSDVIDEIMALAIEDLTNEESGAKLNAEMIMQRYNSMLREWRGRTKEVYGEDGVRFETVLTPEGELLRKRIAERFGNNLLECGCDGE